MENGLQRGEASPREMNGREEVWGDKVHLPRDPAVLLVGVYPRQIMLYVHTDTWIWRFIAPLFITAKSWKWPRCPWTVEWINKLWYIRNVKSYTAEKEWTTLLLCKNIDKSQKHDAKWKKLLSKAHLYDFIYLTSWKRQRSDRSVVAGGLGSENWLEGGTRSVCDRIVLYLNCGGGYMTTYICQNSSNYNLRGWISLYVGYTIILSLL